jgi:hypothetical protein
MKTKTLFTCSLFLYLILITASVSAQERLQSIETGISLLGRNKTSIQSYLINKGFRFNNQTRNGLMIEYTKNARFGRYEFGVGIKNQKINTISWNEHVAYLPSQLSELQTSGFENSDESGNGMVYSFKSYSRNILISIIVRQNLNDFVITIGKINDLKPIINTPQQSSEPQHLFGDDVPYDETTVEKFNNFIPQSNKVVWSNLNVLTYETGIDYKLISKASMPLKAIFSYYASISALGYDFTQALGFGTQCSAEQSSSILRYFNNDEAIKAQIGNCGKRADGADASYLLNRLEFSQDGGLVSVSFAMTYYMGNKSQDDIVGVDKFKINDNQTITVLHLASKETATQR